MVASPRMSASVMLFRHVGQKELELIRGPACPSSRRGSRGSRSSTRTEQEHAVEIARDWKTKDAAPGTQVPSSSGETAPA